MSIECHLTDVAKSCPCRFMFSQRSSIALKFYKIRSGKIFVLERFQSFQAPFRVFLGVGGYRNCAVFSSERPREALTAFPERRKLLVSACCFCPEKLLFFCRKAFPRLQQRPCCVATVAPLQRRGGLVATPGGPYGKSAAAPWFSNEDIVVCMWL